MVCVYACSPMASVPSRAPTVSPTPGCAVTASNVSDSILPLPEALSISAIKPLSAKTDLYLVNLKQVRQEWELSFAEDITKRLLQNAIEIKPNRSTVGSLQHDNVVLFFNTTGLARGKNTLQLLLKAVQLSDDEQPRPCTLTATEIELQVNLETQASPTESRVTYSEQSPVLGKTWYGPTVKAVDADGFEIDVDTGEDFRVSLARESSDGDTDSASCEIGWNEADKVYKTSCDVPYNLGVAGLWSFQIELKPRTGSSQYKQVTSKKLAVRCPQGEYMYDCGDDFNATACDLSRMYRCMPCDLQEVVCVADAEKLSKITLKAGYWRSGPISEKFESCLYPSACAGGNVSSSYCNQDRGLLGQSGVR